MKETAEEKWITEVHFPIYYICANVWECQKTKSKLSVTMWEYVTKWDWSMWLNTTAFYVGLKKRILTTIQICRAQSNHQWWWQTPSM